MSLAGKRRINWVGPMIKRMSGVPTSPSFATNSSIGDNSSAIGPQLASSRQQHVYWHLLPT
eukprot:4973171-Amphidinium_carterae.1